MGAEMGTEALGAVMQPAEARGRCEREVQDEAARGYLAFVRGGGGTTGTFRTCSTR
jgi:hypothetical protein